MGTSTAKSASSWAARSATPIQLKISAIGFLIAAVGTFVIPHEKNLAKELYDVMTVGASTHERAVWGVGLILAGMGVGLGGAAAGFAGKNEAN